jgi:hypothetical protein
LQHTREQLDGAIVVGRTEAARRDQQIRLDARAQRTLEFGFSVADDLDPSRLEAEGQQLAREERPVPVRPLAANQLTARDDDDRAWADGPALPLPNRRQASLRHEVGGRAARGDALR